MTAPDAVVIGSGPHGLVAANILADAGWHVVVEACDRPGGAVRSDRGVHPDYVHGVFSACARLRLLRTMLLPSRRFGEEHFDGDGGRLLIAGNALHADLGPESALGGGFGWLMCMLGRDHGFPVPVGGRPR